MSNGIALIEETRQDVTFLHVMDERLLDPQQADVFAKHLCGQFESGTQCLVVDLGSVKCLSSVFFRSFIMAGKKAASAKAKLAFCNLSPIIREGFELTGLTNLFPVFKSETEAFNKLASK